MRKQMAKSGDRFDNALSLLRDIQRGRFKYSKQDESYSWEAEH
jgi:hypothetical protein